MTRERANDHCKTERDAPRLDRDCLAVEFLDRLLEMKVLRLQRRVEFRRIHGVVTPNNQRLSAAQQRKPEARTSMAADKPCWTEPPVMRWCALFWLKGI